jgi:hypothetical protein
VSGAKSAMVVRHRPRCLDVEKAAISAGVLVRRELTRTRTGAVPDSSIHQAPRLCNMSFYELAQTYPNATGRAEFSAANPGATACAARCGSRVQPRELDGPPTAWRPIRTTASRRIPGGPGLNNCRVSSRSLPARTGANRFLGHYGANQQPHLSALTSGYPLRSISMCHLDYRNPINRRILEFVGRGARVDKCDDIKGAAFPV